MALTLTVVWGGRWENSQRLTPSLLNAIFEQASFQLQGTIDSAAAPPGGIDSTWIGNTFVSGLAAATPEGPDYLLGHDTSAGAPRKFLVSDVLSLGFGAAPVVTTLAEADEFSVVVGGVVKKVALPVARIEILDAPNALTWTGIDIVADGLCIRDASATEAKKVTPADLVRSVTDRVIVTTGTAPAFTATTGLSLAALATGIRLVVRFHQAGGATPTFAPDGLTAKAIRTADDYAIESGQIASGRLTELVYDAGANSGAGAWLAQSILKATTLTSCVFDSSIATVGSSCTLDSGTGVVTTSGAHGLTTGDILWFTTTAAGVTGLRAYYAIVLTSTTLKIANTKALALAGTNTSVGTGSNYYLRWSSNPLIRAVNVDGIVRRALGRYYVDFATALPDTTYAVQITSTSTGITASTAPSAALDTEFYARDVQGFGVMTFANTSDYQDSAFVNVVVFP